MPEVAFVMSAGQHYMLRELAETLKYELELQGVPCSLHVGGFPAVASRRVYVLLDPREYARIEGMPTLPEDAILRRTVFVCCEAPSTIEDEHLKLLKRAGAVFVLDQRSRVAMERLGIAARLLRPGYSKSLDHYDPDAARPIDVMFLGARSPRRAKYLNNAAEVLSQHNFRLQIRDGDSSPVTAGTSLAGSRWPLLAQAKVLINLHRGDDSRFEWRRALDAIHAGAVVVTEHSSGIAPLVPGEHLLVASPDALPYVAEAVLRDDGRLATLRAHAYERLTTWIPFALPVSVLRAAVVELVGEPVSLRSSLGAPPADSISHSD